MVREDEVTHGLMVDLVKRLEQRTNLVVHLTRVVDYPPPQVKGAWPKTKQYNILFRHPDDSRIQFMYRASNANEVKRLLAGFCDMYDFGLLGPIVGEKVVQAAVMHEG